MFLPSLVFYYFCYSFSPQRSCLILLLSFFPSLYITILSVSLLYLFLYVASSYSFYSGLLSFQAHYLSHSSLSPSSHLSCFTSQAVTSTVVYYPLFLLSQIFLFILIFISLNTLSRKYLIFSDVFRNYLILVLICAIVFFLYVVLSLHLKKQLYPIPHLPWRANLASSC